MLSFSFSRTTVTRRILFGARLHRRTLATLESQADIRALLEKKAYWKDMYREGSDLFTLEDVNANLQRHFHLIKAAIAKQPQTAHVPRVLVPLCGRDISVAWIARHENMGSVGVDFVDEPLRMLGNEIGGLVPLVDEPGRMSAYQGALERIHRVILVHGDFFALEEGDYGGRFEAVWDRAALTAVEPERRHDYVDKLYRLLAEQGVILLEALTCNVHMQGAMQAHEPAQLLEQGGFEVKVLQDTDVRSSYPDFDAPGLTYLREQLLFATKIGPPVVRRTSGEQKMV